MSFKKKKKAAFLASDECYYKDLTATHKKSLLWADALHRACCYFQIPAGSERFIPSVLVSVTPDFQSDIQSAFLTGYGPPGAGRVAAVWGFLPIHNER